MVHFLSTASMVAVYLAEQDPKLTTAVGDLVGSLIGVLKLAVPAVVAAFMIHKAVTAGESSVKILIAEGVILVGVLEGVMALVSALSQQAGPH
ncbi:MAG: hypothetical protein ACREP9_19545 [Candidatus Dormibacteraceae bacterium]